MKKAFWTIPVLVCCALAVLFAARTAFAPSEPQSQRTHLKIGVEQNYHPFCYIGDNGKLTGFDVQLSIALCRRMNRVCSVVPMQFSELLPALREERLDMLVAGVGETEERRRDFAFSNTYYRSRSFFITSDPSLRKIDVDIAARLVIGVQKGSLQQEFIEKAFVPAGARMIVYDTYQDTVTAINKGEINVIFTDGIPGYAILNSPEGKNLFIGGRPNPSKDWPAESSLTEAKIAARLADQELIDEVNQTLLKMQADGEYQELHARFFPFVNF